MVFLNLRGGSKAGLLFHSKRASRRRARSGGGEKRCQCVTCVLRPYSALANAGHRRLELTFIRFQHRAHVIDGKVYERPYT
jgi:hypothetical protein